jgi:formylglycine-generating enzyme required for sulfatase activity
MRTAYGYGSDASLLDHFGWFMENSGKRVHPPRRLLPSIRGLFDMHGNLFEWSHDWYDDYGSAKMVDPRGPKGGSSRVDRGGSWGPDAAYCRSANRDSVAPSFRSNNFGLRPALSLSGVPPEAGSK